jgi:hypothetical protein
VDRELAESRSVLSGNAHFSLEASGEPTSAGRFVGPHDVAPVEFIDGLEFEIDGEVRTMRHGDIAVIPTWVPHGARTNDTTCLEVDVFNPPRKTLVDHAVAQRDAATS